jgi:plastocyanin
MTTYLRRISMIAGCTLVAALLAACSNPGPEPRTEAPSDTTGAPQQPEGNGSSGNDRAQSKPASERVDPRRGGLQMSLGEWAVTPESNAIRPGPVTIVVSNRGTIDHGFEIEDDTDHSGSGGGDGLKFETDLLAPGESTRVRLNLAPGVYKIECLVDGHDDMGMEGFLRVAPDAPLVAQRDEEDETGDVAIANFSFSPEIVEVRQGSLVSWRNDDPTEHTVTAEDGTFDSGVLAAGDKFATRLRRLGTYTYICNIHPDMTASIEVVR